MIFNIKSIFFFFQREIWLFMYNFRPVTSNFVCARLLVAFVSAFQC